MLYRLLIFGTGSSPIWTMKRYENGRLVSEVGYSVYIELTPKSLAATLSSSYI